MEQRIGIERMEEAINLFGSFDENIRLLESEFQGVYYELSGKPGVHRQNHPGNSQCPGTGSYA